MVRIRFFLSLKKIYKKVKKYLKQIKMKQTSIMYFLENTKEKVEKFLNKKTKSDTGKNKKKPRKEIKNYIEVVFKKPNQERKIFSETFIQKNPNLFASINGDEFEPIADCFAEEGVSQMKIKFTGPLPSLEAIFMENEYLTYVSLNNFNLHNIKSLRLAFSDCYSLKEAKICSVDTPNLAEIDHMLSNCGALEKISFMINTSNIRDAEFAFSGCAKLKKIDLYGFDFKKAQSIDGMFMDCSSLVYADLGKINFESVTSATSLFMGCTMLQKINMEGTGMKSLRFFSFAFKNCHSLIDFKMETANWKSIIIATKLFENCFSLVSVDLTGLDIKQASPTSLFENCYSLTDVKFESETGLFEFDVAKEEIIKQFILYPNVLGEWMERLCKKNNSCNLKQVIDLLYYKSN